MTIIYNPTFTVQLIQIIDFIAEDKVSASITFALNVEKSIILIPEQPYKYRKSLYFNDDNVRDMIYKGYTVVYEIDTMNKVIEILEIFNKNKP